LTEAGPEATETRSRRRGVDHVGYMVAEVERSMRWLGEILGASPVGPIVSIPGTEIRVGALVLGDFEWEIVEHPQGRDGPYRVAADALGAHRILLETSNMARAGAHLSALGVEFEQNPDWLRFRDPDGFAYEVAASPPAEPEASAPSLFDGAVRAFGFNVRSLARSQEWYQRSFGLPAVPGPGEASALLAAGRAGLLLRETAAAAAAPPLTGLGPAHPAIEVDDVEESWVRMEREQATVLIPPRRDEHEGSRRLGRTSFFLADPDGLPVQVIGPPL
jgi:catechol 2,3-dioxygenase-like lactoylglutathione lyase family enzyme